VVEAAENDVVAVPEDGVQPTVTRAGSAISCVGALSTVLTRSAYGARPIAIEAVAVLSFSPFGSTTEPLASTRTIRCQAPETSMGSVVVAEPT